jgi:biotin carboxylase
VGKRPRVLLAQTTDWISISRIPAMLTRVGIDCDLVDGGGTAVSASCHIRNRTAIPGDAEGIAREVLRVGDAYDRVVMCNERLIHDVMSLGGEGANRILPGDRAGQRAMCNKTLFSPTARAGGLRVADYEITASAEQAEQAAARLGGRVVVKGRWGVGGDAVRIVDSPEAAAEAASATEAKLGMPVLVEAFVDGDLVMTPSLYHDGKLVAAMAARKLELMPNNGPSTVNEFFLMDDRLRTVCERMGEVFGLSGFASADIFLIDGGDPVVLEINPRPVPQLHLGASLGVDMAAAFADVLSGRWDGTPRLASRSRTVRLFPQGLIRSRRIHGVRKGNREWMKTPGVWADVPWEDFGLLGHHFREFAGGRG